MVVCEPDYCSLLWSPLQHSQAAVHLREDMKRLVQPPFQTPRPQAPGGPRPQDPGGPRLFGVALAELQERGLLEDGVPQQVRRMVEHLREHGEERRWSTLESTVRRGGGEIGRAHV